MSTRLAVVFDFDDTLAHDSTSGFLASIGVDVDHFWGTTVAALLEDGWDPIPAYLHAMIGHSKARNSGDRITLERLEHFGRTIEFFPGVPEIFDTLRTAAREVDSSIEIEFYLISSGIETILRATAIAHEFHDIWACRFHADAESSEICFPRNVVSFTEKTRFLFQISKGVVGPAMRSRVHDVNRKVRDGQFRIPLNRMIFVGDGLTDVPCFALVKRYGGIPIGVYDAARPSKWEAAWSFIEDGRVTSLHAAKFSPGDDLYNMLLMAVRNRAAADV
ncbi:MAG: haloacid dehalogenase-like hydrolase [Phycisphaerales bacterium]